MAKKRHSQTWTQSDALAEVVSAASCRIVLGTPPPGNVEKISRCLESSVGPDETSEAPSEADSDSGDSLFITQKPVPEPVRSGRGRPSSPGSDPWRLSPRGLEESEDDTSPSMSHGESRAGKEKKRTRHKLPKCSFSFLRERGWRPSSTALPAKHNTRLHNFAMGGFFKCVQELWERCDSGEDGGTSLLTVDMDGEDISPISEEEEEEKPEDEDVKVVERRHFVVPSKVKSAQTWYKKERRRRRRPSADGHEMPQRGRWKMPHKVPRVTMSSDTESSEEGDCSGRVQTSVQQVTSDRSTLEQTATPQTKRRPTRAKKAIVFPPSETEDELCEDSDAAVCESSPKKCVHKGGDATVTEPQVDVLHTDEPSPTGQGEREPDSQNVPHSGTSDTVCSGPRVEKKDKGDSESVEGDGHAATSTEVEETPSLSRTIDGPELNEQVSVGCSPHGDNMLRRGESDSPDLKLKKKKRRERTPAAGGDGQEVEGHTESDVRVEEDSVKKKRNDDDDDEEDAEPLKSSAAAEPLSDDAEIPKKKKKKRKRGLNMTSDQAPTERSEEIRDGCEHNEASQETSESSNGKRKKHKKKQQSASNDGAAARDDGCIEVITPAAATELSVKKKKSKAESVDDSHTPEEDGGNAQMKTEARGDQDAELVTKKKKKKKKKISSITNDAVARDDDPVSVQEEGKKKRKKLLGRTRRNTPDTWLLTSGVQKRLPPSQQKSLDVWHLMMESRRRRGRCQLSRRKKITGQLLRGLSMKWRSRDKKKRRRNESESVTSVERSGSAAEAGRPDEAVVLMMMKKKKKKKKKGTQEVRPAADAEVITCTLDTWSSVTHKKKAKHGHSTEISHDGSMRKASKETRVEHASTSSETPGNQRLNGVRDEKKKKKVKFTDKVASAETAAMKVRKSKKDGQKLAADSSLSSASSDFSLTPSQRHGKQKHKKARRTLHNPSADRLSV